MEWRVEEDDGRLRIRWKEAGGKRVTRALGLSSTKINQAIAQGVVSQITLEFLATGTFDRTLKKYLAQPEVVEPSEGVRVVDAIVDYLEGAKHLSKSQRSSIRTALKWATEYFEEENLEAITPQRAKQFRRFLEGKGQSGASIVKIVGNLKLAWDDAIEQGKLNAVNPWPTAREKISVKPSQPPDPFTPDEVKRIIEGFRAECPHYADYVEFCLRIGCRLSEAIGLQWRNVSADCSTIWIGSTLTRGERRSAKSGAATIKLSPALVALFQRRQRGKPDDLIFRGAKGGPINDGYFSQKVWRPMLAKLRIPHRYPYNSRHTYVSNALDNGASPNAIAAVTRHDVRTLFNHYAHKIGGAEVVDYLD